MNHKQQEQINQLKTFLAKARKIPWMQYKDSQALEADISWNASYFFIQLISNAQPSKYFWSLEKTIGFKKDYENPYPSVSFPKSSHLFCLLEHSNNRALRCAMG